MQPYKSLGARLHSTFATPDPWSLTENAALKLLSRVAGGYARLPIVGGVVSTMNSATAGAPTFPTRSVPTTEKL